MNGPTDYRRIGRFSEVKIRGTIWPFSFNIGENKFLKWFPGSFLGINFALQTSACQVYEDML
jgi:hypothetical protein